MVEFDYVFTSKLAVEIFKVVEISHSTTAGKVIFIQYINQHTEVPCTYAHSKNILLVVDWISVGKQCLGIFSNMFGY